MPALKHCYHCGDTVLKDLVIFDNKKFCCHGCKTVYHIFKENNLSDYYQLETTPGFTPKTNKDKYSFLDNEKVVASLLDFEEENLRIVTLYVPQIHCSSCVWILENLQKLNESVVNSRVHFSKKTVQITFNSKLSLLNLVHLLVAIGYEPNIHLESGKASKLKSKKQTYKVAVAGFAFGNTMFLSFPDYFGTTDVWLLKYQPLFTLLMLLFSLPVVFYAASDYFTMAYKGLKKKILNVDVPISMGIAVLFVRSCYEYIAQIGQGYFDSLTGLVFFLLLGKLFQQKTYDFLSFERDFKSYFPIAVTTLVKGNEVTVPVNDIKVNDILLIRNEEIIPTDAVVLKGTPLLDYSFVTGEAHLIQKKSGDRVYAGAKQQGTTIQVQVVKTLNQSYLTKLWSQNSYQDKLAITNVTDQISHYFTWGLLCITFISSIFWWIKDTTQTINVISSILIVACPCALALSAPFATGNVLRILGKKGFYLKNTLVIEKLANLQALFFDKTGTLTSRNQQEFNYEGALLSKEEIGMVSSLVRHSNHPLSRVLYQQLQGKILEIKNYKEKEGSGLKGVYNNTTIKIGAAHYVSTTTVLKEAESRVYVSINNTVKGYFKIKPTYRNSILKALNTLTVNYKLFVLSGDNESAKGYLKDAVPKVTGLYFHQSPQDKLDRIKKQQIKGEQVLMVGDGLNDAGALLQADVGIAVTEDVNVFSPASDAIIDAKILHQLPNYITFCKKSMTVVQISFLIAILYNTVGLYFAISNQLTPLIAAILMPLSSITIVVFVTVITTVLGKKYML